MASPPQDVVKEVSVKPGWLYANVTQKPGHRVMSMLRSVRTRDKAPWMVPVWWELSSSCNFEREQRRRIPAPDMMGGEAWVTEYVMFDVCPGEGVPHTCPAIKEETPFGGIPICIPA